MSLAPFCGRSAFMTTWSASVLVDKPGLALRHHRCMWIEACRGDITRQHVDAVVNAANSLMVGGGGVDGKIHAAAGPELLAECRRVRRLSFPDGVPVGEAVATGAGRLPARWVIHTVGPNWNRGDRDPARLASCFTRSLDVAAGLGARSVAFPAVSAGSYGWSPRDVAEVAITAVRGWDATANGGVELVRFVLFDDAALAPFAQLVGSGGPEPSAVSSEPE